MCLVIHEDVDSMVDSRGRDWTYWNTSGVEDLHLNIILYGLVDKIKVLMSSSNRLVSCWSFASERRSEWTGTRDASILPLGKVGIVVNHHRCCLLHPTYILKHFAKMNPPCAPMPRMVVDLVVSNFTTTKLENKLRNSFNVERRESVVHGNPVSYELTHPIQHEGRQSNMSYHCVPLPNWIVPINHWDVPKWHRRKHRVRR
jgi:hypothetical protein